MWWSQAGRGRVLIQASRGRSGASTNGVSCSAATARSAGGEDRPAPRHRCHVLSIGINVDAELPGLLASATALLVLSSTTTWLLKIRRSMACGVPVIASDVDQLSGLVENDFSGLVVEAGDLAA